MAIDLVRRSLAPDLDAPPAARRALDGFGQLEEDVIERSALVVSEVVTNSVTHAGLTAAQPIDLNIQVLPGCLRIEVTDEGTAGFNPVVTLPDPGRKRVASRHLALLNATTRVNSAVSPHAAFCGRTFRESPRPLLRSALVAS